MISVQKTVRLSPEQHARLEKAVSRGGISENKYIVQALDEKLARDEKRKKK
jgi:predicted HicB family RNase H-like nuclease